MLTKTWTCPHCGQGFIVAADAVRDVCPWCKATVEEKAGGLEQAPAQPTQAVAGAPTSSSSTAKAPAEMWWPYEYDPF